MKSPFLERLERGPLLADGAMGSMLYAEGVDYSHCFDELNLSNPSLIQSIHRLYIAAGSELIETNTFGANRFRLETYGLAHKVRDINFQGARLAREAREVAGEWVFVAGSLGPSGLAFRPGLKVSPSSLKEAFREQVEALLEGGVDLFVLETFADLEETKLAVGAVKEACDLPVMAQLTFNEDGRTLAGHSPQEVVETLEALGVDVIGVNCTLGPQGTLEIIEKLAALTKLPLSAMPAAGQPMIKDGRFFYLSTPQYFGEYARRFIQAGVSVLGGCCGTTPEHIKAMKEAIKDLQPSPSRTLVGVVEPPPAYEDRGQAEGPTLLAQKLPQGKFVVSVELDPPKGINPTKVLIGAAMLKELGVDCINIGDSPMARVRMSCLAMAYLIKERVGLETIIHFTTRDRNLMALQSDLIGAHAMGVRNILALTGDPPRLGDYPNATGVWDVDSIGLVSILKGLNQGRDWSGNSIAHPTSFFVGVAVSPATDDLPKEKERFRRKVEAGADFTMTQPLFDMDDLNRFLEEFSPIPIPVILGVLPLQSYRHAEFLHHEVPGINVPDHIREAMRRAGERGMEEGIKLACEFVSQIKGKVAGVYLMPSFGRYEMVGEIVKILKG